MLRACAVAIHALGRQRPNPQVGCLIVRGGRVLAEGFHAVAGGPHAEIAALAELRHARDARGATVYVTLEPCNHVGRTGPCAEALIAAGVKRVVVGMRDPNPRVRGGGVERLKRAGIAVEVGVMREACEGLNADWLHWIKTGRPRVRLKAAVTLDGRLAARGGDSRWVSSDESRKYAHHLRARNHAIMVGARTVALDDPRLDARVPRSIDPLRVVLDGKLSTPPRWRALAGSLIATTRDAPESRAAKLRARGAEVVRLPGRAGRVDLGALLDELGRRELQSLLVEGGGDVHGQLVERGLADELILFIAPKLVGAGGVPLIGAPGPKTMAEAWPLEGFSTRRLGGDIFVHGWFAREAKRRRM
jgi:diaminohydroxyphosphoribosylaminopyrimidine deaminase/5-amino-6-(5-phosphoribosylamino)uracil reductase